MQYIRLIFVCIILSNGLLIAGCKTSKGPKTVLPNVVILLADDLGYGDLGCYGGVGAETPQIDQLAAEGMRFTHFYAASAVCSPSRASILSGLFPIRMDIRQAFTEKDAAHLPTEVTILPELLREKGYFSAMIGKWHLGGNRPHHIDARQKGEASELPGPLQQGFDYYLTTIEGEPPRQTLIRERRMYAESGKYLVRNDKRIAAIHKQWDEIKTDEAIQLMDSCKTIGKPFFLHMCFDAPHEPYERVPGTLDSIYRSRGHKQDQLFFRARVTHLDEQVGKIIHALKSKGLFENTLILFTSDNGAIHEGNPGPFKGGKTDLHEGGLRVPMLAVWKGIITPFTVNQSLTHHADIVPTICDFLGIDHSKTKYDGRSMKQALSGAYIQRDAPMFFQLDKYEAFQGHGPRPEPHITTALIEGNNKYTTDELRPAQLFNLSSDYREDYNRIKDEPETVKRLHTITLQFWNDKRFYPYPKGTPDPRILPKH
ncbi:MAG TPA: sulfatase-like hydrolase/transferase [Phnomibacter sp.]|nr:sulfatase-like hydrolase/transferase [Phnomibacter sp.]